jgi:hypothetical protein
MVLSQDPDAIRQQPVEANPYFDEQRQQQRRGDDDDSNGGFTLGGKLGDDKEDI